MFSAVHYKSQKVPFWLLLLCNRLHTYTLLAAEVNGDGGQVANANIELR